MRIKSVGLILSVLLSQASFGFTLTQDNLRGFRGEIIDVSLNSANCPSSIEDDLDFAIELWNNVPGSRLRLHKESPNAVAPSTYSSFGFLQTILVGCSTNFNTDSGGAGPTTIGVGTSNKMGTSYLQKGYLILNEEGGSGQFSTQTPVVRRFVVAHELGHVLGLGHTSVKAGLMYPSVSTKAATNLHQDDMDGIIYLYPIDEFSESALYGCGTVGMSARGNGPGSSAILLAFLLLLLPLAMGFGLRRRVLLSR